jgi:2Fe-2S ferredoxin
MLGSSAMARIRVVFESGEPERVIEFDPTKAPFQHDGRPGSILDVLLANGIHLEHACGGNCACTTCHVIVKGGGNALTPNEEEEDYLLDKAPGLTPTSRLGCQAVVTDPNAEITIVVPRYTINQVSGTHG